MSFLDIETAIRTLLLPLVSPVKVGSRVPATLPAEFVRAWRTGGTAANQVLDRPIITVQAWAGDDTRALELAGKCRDAILADAGAIPQVRAPRTEEITGLYYDPDPESKTDRYSFSVQLSVRAPR